MNLDVYEVIKVHNIIHPKTKVPLPMFFVDLRKNDNCDKIFSLQYLFYTKIIVEEPFHRNEIVQCKRCQSYGHTKSYCNLKPRCVKCAGSHLSENCKKTRDEPPICVHCKQDHPANYRGCIVHKELKRLRQHPSARSPGFYAQSEGQRKSEDSQNNAAMPVRSLVPPSQLIHPDQTKPTHSHVVSTLATSTQINTKTDTTPLPNPTPYNSESSVITTQLTNFINEFKNLVTPLITLLNTLVQHLLPRITA